MTTTEPLTIQVPSRLAKHYRDADEQEQRKLDLILSFRLQDVVESRGTLRDLIREISEEAQANGLTPEILEDILNDK
jgi:hypothetical protein